MMKHVAVLYVAVRKKLCFHEIKLIGKCHVLGL
jgi:hypothetical protein